MVGWNPRKLSLLIRNFLCRRVGRESKQLTTRNLFLTKREKSLEYSNIGLAARIANVVDSDKKGGTTGAQAQRRGDGQGWSVFRHRRLSRNNVHGWV